MIEERLDTDDEDIGDSDDMSGAQDGGAAGDPDNSSGRPVANVDASEPPETNGRRRRFVFIGGAVIFILAIAGLAYWLYARQFESTDDAFIDGDIIQVSPKVSAYISRIYVKNNQFVHKGDLLVELDQKDLEAKLEQAKAELESARSRHGVAVANVDLTTKTANAGQVQAKSNVETSRTNVEQTRIAAKSKLSLISHAKAVVATARANLAQTRSLVPQAESNVHLAQIEYDRRRELFGRGDISQQALDQATNSFQTAQAQLDAVQKQVLAAQSRVDEANAGVNTADENYRQSLAQIDLTRSEVGESRGRMEDANAAPERITVSQSQVTAAEAETAAAEALVHQAELDLSYTKIFAAEDGFVTKKTVEEGQLVQIGAPMMALSLSDDIWVVANFKETQLEHMRVGQSVEISVDAYPDATFRGKVESFQAGTGSRFSLLPSENATGNYVKVVQRVPVKIVFDEKPDNVHLLAPGMSVEPSVRVR